MTIVTDVNGSSSVKPLEVKLTATEGPLAAMNVETHRSLLDFLMGRLNAGAQDRDMRIARYANIDRIISTWQKLSPEDSQRQLMEDFSGRNQAIPINLPLLATHLEDMTAYFTEVFYPTGGAFYMSRGEEAEKAVAEKMNQDAAARNTYGAIMLAMRSLLKYNVGGVEVAWENPDGEEMMEEAGNQWAALDMYNTLWDPGVTKVENLSTQGEWAAMVTVENRFTILRKALKGQYHRVGDLLAAETTRTELAGRKAAKTAKFYKQPFMSAGLPADGTDSRTQAGEQTGQQEVNWGSFGVGIEGEGSSSIEGYEVVRMYCWIRPKDFNLLTADEEAKLKGLDVDLDSYIELWRFHVADGSVVISADRVVEMQEGLVQSSNNSVQTIGGGVLPVFLSHMTQDQMAAAARSVMEYMRGFQRFGSFLMNIYIAGMRKNIWGLKALDPTMFDPSQIKNGEVAGLLLSKIPGRDVRTAFHDITTASGVQETSNAMTMLMGLVKEFFPAQALPTQVASIDRAVKSQVSAVTAGSQRRHHMMAKSIDRTLMRPARLESFKNLRRAGELTGTDITDEAVAKVIGSGLESLESERILEILRDFFFAILQNPESAAQYDVPKILAYMSRIANMSIDLGQFAKQTNPAIPQAGAPANGQVVPDATALAAGLGGGAPA